jgi:hypothetical protein
LHARAAHAAVRQSLFLRAAISSLRPAMHRHVLLGFGGLSTEPLLVAGLDHRAAAWVALVEQLREEVAVPAFVENQFALGRCGAGLCGPDLEESGTRAIRAADFHHGQIGSHRVRE